MMTCPNCDKTFNGYKCTNCGYAKPYNNNNKNKSFVNKIENTSKTCAKFMCECEGIIGFGGRFFCRAHWQKSDLDNEEAKIVNQKFNELIKTGNTIPKDFVYKKTYGDYRDNLDKNN